jgi:negative regulator of sigma E activity
MKEQLSAFIDGELNDLERERILRELGRDAALRSAWERYHLASTAMRRELDMTVSPGLADRIRDRLRDEQPDPVRSLAIGRLRHSRRALRLGAGLAIAASVAVVAILNIQPVLSPTPSAQVAKVTPAQEVADLSQVAAQDSHQALPEQQRALNAYLVHHAEFTPAAGMNGILGYVPLVGRENNNSPGTNDANQE